MLQALLQTPPYDFRIDTLQTTLSRLRRCIFLYKATFYLYPTSKLLETLVCLGLKLTRALK